MTYKGKVKNGVIVLEPPAELPEGAEVEVSEVSADDSAGKQQQPGVHPKSLYEELEDFVGSFDGLPDDASENVDHYLYGAPKK